MQQASSLQDIMNDIAGGNPDAIKSQLNKAAPASKKMDELEAFIAIDPLLANLNKDYLEAKNHHKALIAQFGANDPMVEVALDMEDSAWCAMQTRYLELRDQRELMAKAQQIMFQSERQHLASKKKEIEKERQRQFELYLAFLKMIEKKKEKERRFNIGTFEALFVMMIFKMIPPDYRSSFNQKLAAA
jgi:hypothetical protein